MGAGNVKYLVRSKRCENVFSGMVGRFDNYLTSRTDCLNIIGAHFDNKSGVLTIEFDAQVPYQNIYDYLTIAQNGKPIYTIFAFERSKASVSSRNSKLIKDFKKLGLI